MQSAPPPGRWMTSHVKRPEDSQAVAMSVRFVETTQAGGMTITVMTHAPGCHAHGHVEREDGAGAAATVGECPHDSPARAAHAPEGHRELRKPLLTGVSAARLQDAAATAMGPAARGPSPPEAPPQAPPPPAPPHGSSMRPQKLPDAHTLHQLVAGLSPEQRQGGSAKQDWRRGGRTGAQKACVFAPRGWCGTANSSPKGDLLLDDQTDRQRHWQQLCDQRSVLARNPLISKPAERLARLVSTGSQRPHSFCIRMHACISTRIFRRRHARTHVRTSHTLARSLAPPRIPNKQVLQGELDKQAQRQEHKDLRRQYLLRMLHEVRHGATKREGQSRVSREGERGREGGPERRRGGGCEKMGWGGSAAGQ